MQPCSTSALPEQALVSRPEYIISQPLVSQPIDQFPITASPFWFKAKHPQTAFWFKAACLAGGKRRLPLALAPGRGLLCQNGVSPSSLSRGLLLGPGGARLPVTLSGTPRHRSLITVCAIRTRGCRGFQKPRTASRMLRGRWSPFCPWTTQC